MQEGSRSLEYREENEIRMAGLRIKSENDISHCWSLFCGGTAGMRPTLGCQTFLQECVDWQMCLSLQPVSRIVPSNRW